MRKHFYLLLAFLFAQSAWAQEKLLYSTDFQNWTAFSAATEQTFPKTTDFSGETLNFKLFQVWINPTGRDETRFKYTPQTAPNVQVTDGWAQAQKVAGSYMELSPLKSITKVTFVHGATGSSRGYKLWKKNATDADWVVVSSAFASPSAGQEVTVNINDTNVALKFTNLAETQNAYMFSLKIYGNYVSANPQFPLTTSLNIEAAGTVTKTPNSDNYDQGTSVNLQATPNFGYKFIKWTDSTDAELSTTNPYAVTVNSKQKIKAVFAAVNTYTLDVTKLGSKWGEISLTPAPNNGKYEEGTEVTMKVVPNAVTNFSYWEDNSTVSQRVVTMNANKSFTATFDEVPFIVGWDFRSQTPTSSRPGDYSSETSNTGTINLYESVNGAAPVVKGWLASLGAFSPSYPHVRFWSAGAEFKTTRRHLKAQFATTNYKNVQVKSMISGNYQAYSIMTMQYSLDDITFKEFARADLTQTFGSSWKDLNAVLPVEAENQPKVYVRWIADTTSPIINEGTDNDGTAVTNVFVFGDKNVPPDNVAPVFVSAVPASGSATATTSGSIVVTFDEKLKAGSGDITLGSTVLTGSYGSKTVTFKYEKLNYDTEYTFTIPSGALTDLSGNVFAGLTYKFRTGKRTEPTKKVFDAVVAKDGSGDYTSVIDAIAAAPTGRTLPWLIYIKNGKYVGHHDIPSNKPFIHLIGQKRDSVILSDSRLSGGPNAVHVSLGATMVVNSKDVYFENLTLENSVGYENLTGPQALALYALTDRFATNNVWLRSYQDTYLTAYSNINDRQYLKNSKIEGAVDYIYGGGDVFFDRCTLTNNRADGGYIVAPSHATGTLWGYVFSNCTIDESPRISNGSNYFGRPWQNAPKTVFINTTLKSGIKPAGWWYKMGAIPAVFADYNTMDKDGNPVDLSQRISEYEYDVKDANGNVTSTVKGTAKSSLTDAEAANYSYENVILRSGDTWDPRMMAEAPENPSNVQISGASLTWNSVPYTRLYIVFRNQAVVGFTITNSYTDATALGGTSYTYAVQAVGEFGALSGLTQAVVAGAKQAQTIAFNALTGKNTADADFDAGATASSGLAVSLSSSNTAVATIVNGKIHIVGAGTTTITASQAGDASWLAATAVGRELVVTAAQQSQTITFNAFSPKTVTDTDFDASATASSGLAVSLSSSNTAVATILNGKIHIVGAGTTTITASQAGDATWLAATPVSRDLVVTATQQSQTITFNALSAKTVTDADFDAGATASSGLAVSLSSSNTAVATIVSGKIHIVGAGTTTITASQAGDASWAAATPVGRELVVSKVAQTITFNVLPAKSITSDDFAAGATASSGLTVSYSSSNTGVATIVNGTIQITGVGSADITASQAGNAQYNAAAPVVRTLVVSDRFKLPANNFQVKASDEVCSTGNDGKINITATQDLAYKASVVINGSNTVLAFTTALEIPSLNAGNYKVCITVDGQADYSQCFDLTVREPQPLSMYSVVKSDDKTVVLNMTGSERYFIRMNNKSYQTTTSSITLPLAEGLNQISVSTEKECQGTIEKSIFISDGHTIYPNPFDQHVFINMGNDSSASANVTLTDLSGARKYAAVQKVQNGVVQVSFSDLPQGMYIINVKTSLTESSSKILKQ
ncbi:pectinesterase family protein [Paradesertivirga mongoliensis]|uniref:Pectinesterase family protein n=1 Tax=Paradesertivirga mongoliensis TaxID=2100740 RepID=A0ABW4ZJY3_9SPHI|nr:pectinesterase family protein [Pedobacter mongoliensis]